MRQDCTWAALGDPGSTTSSSRSKTPLDGRLGSVKGRRAAAPLLMARRSDPTIVRACCQWPTAYIVPALYHSGRVCFFLLPNLAQGPACRP